MKTTHSLIGLSLISTAMAACFTTQASADQYSVMEYQLGMSFADFASKPLPATADLTGGQQKVKLLCGGDPALKNNVIGYVEGDFAVDRKIGVKTCTFMEPESATGKSSWWTPVKIDVAQKPMMWLFDFIDPNGNGGPKDDGKMELFSIRAEYVPDWQHRSAPADDMTGALETVFGPAKSLDYNTGSRHMWSNGESWAQLSIDKPVMQEASTKLHLVVSHAQLMEEYKRRYEEEAGQEATTLPNISY